MKRCATPGPRTPVGLSATIITVLVSLFACAPLSVIGSPRALAGPRAESLATLVGARERSTGRARAHDDCSVSGPDTTTLEWLHISPSDPQTIFVGNGGTILRSRDGGASWTDVGQRLFALSDGWVVTIDDPVLTPDGEHLYTSAGHTCITPGGSYSSLMVSGDGGDHWRELVPEWEGIGFGMGYYTPVISPALPTRLYDLFYPGGNSNQNSLLISNDAGSTFQDTGAKAYDLNSDVVPDPTLPNTVYFDAGPVRRSDDMGKTWSTVITPTVTPALHSFSVSLDSLLPGTLVGQTEDKTVPADTRYYSTDHGQTWAAGTCPGDLHGVCPRVRVGPVFGAGQSYAFVGDGIYAFQGEGPAARRLAISDRLPVPIKMITAVQAGPRPGDPVYLLANGKLYRTLDGGQSWRSLRVTRGPTPNLLPPSTASGTLLVPTTHHSVARAFVGTYRRLGLDVIGYPVTEAYLLDGALVQDFQRLRLRLGQGGQVVVAPLGKDLFAYYARQQGAAALTYQRAATPIGAVPGTATLRYFPGTRHTLSGALLGYWRQHGGIAVFGAPISEVFRANNGDGSGRQYQMQYFENARLELHPESRDTRYAVQVGLLGDESLIERGWFLT